MGFNKFIAGGGSGDEVCGRMTSWDTRGRLFARLMG